MGYDDEKWGGDDKPEPYDYELYHELRRSSRPSKPHTFVTRSYWDAYEERHIEYSVCEYCGCGKNKETIGEYCIRQS